MYKRQPVPDPAGGVAADPFFYMPYRAKEESIASTANDLNSDAAGKATSVTPAKPAIKSAAKPVGALLGGFKKKT